jgi:hypothetical protein
MDEAIKIVVVKARGRPANEVQALIYAVASRMIELQAFHFETIGAAWTKADEAEFLDWSAKVSEEIQHSKSC